MTRTRDEETGEYNTHLRADDALDVFRGREDRAKPLGSTDIQEALGWSRGTVHNKLDELVEDDKLDTRTIGSRTRVWWQPLPRDAVSEQYRGIPTSPEDIRGWVDITARTEQVAKNRARAIYAAYELLRDQGEATNEELQEVGVEANPDDESSSSHGHWVNYLRDSLRTLPGTIPPGRSKSEWHFIDPNGELAERLDIDLDDWVEDIETPGSGTEATRLRAILQLAHEHLQQEGEAGKKDFKKALPSYTARYSEFNGLWSYYLREALMNAPSVESDTKGRFSTFRYVGE